MEELFKFLIRFEIGFGDSVSFWNDSWCLNYPLACTFPDLFRVASTRFSTAADNFQGIQEELYSWLMGVDERAKIDNQNIYSYVQSLLYNLHVKECPDKLCWKDGSNSFTVKDML